MGTTKTHQIPDSFYEYDFECVFTDSRCFRYRITGYIATVRGHALRIWFRLHREEAIKRKLPVVYRP